VNPARSPLPLALLLGLLLVPGPDARADFADAAVGLHGTAQLDFLNAVLAAKPKGAEQPARSLVSSFLYANSVELKPPMDLSSLARDVALAGEAWMAHAESLYSQEQFAQAGEALSRIPEGYRRNAAARVESLQVRLALRGVGKPPGPQAATATDLLLPLNLALASLRAGDRAGGIRQLKVLLANAANPAEMRHRASLWLALLFSEVSDQREVLQALSAIDASTPILADALLAYVRIFNDIHPSAASAIVHEIAARAPESPLLWEAREYLSRALLGKGASTQAMEVALETIAAASATLTRLDQQLAGAEQQSAAELTALLPMIPDGRRQRVLVLREHKENLLKAAALLKAWRPHVDAYQDRLQRSPSQFAADIRSAFSAAGAGEDGKARGKLGTDGLFLLSLNNLVGAPPNRDTAYRLFFGLAQWEFGVEYPDMWRPAIEYAGEAVRENSRRQRRDQMRREKQDQDLLTDALEHVNKLAEKVNTKVGKLPGFVFEGMAREARSIAERNRAQLVEIERILPLIDNAARGEVVAGLQERRMHTQQWLNRLAFRASALYTRSSGATEQAHFDLGKRLSRAPGTSLTQSIQAVNSGPEKRQARDLPVLAAWQAVKPLIQDGVTREIRADALRLRAHLTVALHEAQAIPSAEEAIGAYQTLLRDYGDLVDRADVTYQLARAQDLAQHPEQSLATLSDFVKSHRDDPRSLEAWFRIGESHFALGDYTLARTAYQSVLRGDASRYGDQAEYKLAWAMFKQGEYRDALPRFMAVIDRGYGTAETPDRQREQRLRDTFRAVSLTFSYLDGAPDVERFFAKAGARAYTPDIYANLADFYLDHDRIHDAAGSFGYLTRYYPNDARAPLLLAGIVKGARKEKLAKLSLELQERFVDTYALSGAYWKQAAADVKTQINTEMRPFLAEMAQMYHADAQQQRTGPSYEKAIRYYGQYIDTFPADGQTPPFHFLLAEARFETGDFAGALADYEKAAYQYGMHGKAAEAGYAALLANQKLAEATSDPVARKQQLRALVERSSRFARTFAGDARSDAVLVKAGEDILMLGEAAEAARLGEALLARKPEESVRRRAWIVAAHGYFESNDYGKAEQTYQQALALSGHPPVVRQELLDRLGLSVYRQAEAYRAAGHGPQAIDTFLRVARAAPGTEVIANAEIDAAALLLDGKRWSAAIDVLERFARNFPNHKLAAGVPTKLAYAYENDGRFLKAAEMLESLSLGEGNDALARQMLWRAAELREKGARTDLAVATYERYLGRYPQPLETATEVRQMLADIAGKAQDSRTRDRWLGELLTHARPGEELSLRVRFLAARAAMRFGDAKAGEFNAIALTLPLDKSLAGKRNAMELALKWYDEAGRYGVAEVTTAATYNTAELYRRLAKDLMASERPPGLGDLEREQYNVLLEEEAFPFEDKATKVHELNHARLQGGVYDDWVRRSLASLRTLVPGRYERSELPEAPFEYVPPLPPTPPAESKPKTGGAADAQAGK